MSKQAKDDVVRFVNVFPKVLGSMWESLGVCKYTADGGEIGTIKLVIDGETGLLKSAEVVK